MAAYTRVLGAAVADVGATGYLMASEGTLANVLTAVTALAGGTINVTATNIMSLDSGTASAGGATTLTQATKAWEVDAYKGRFVRVLTGDAAGASRLIASNTATVLTVTTAWTVNPASGDTYVIVDRLPTGAAGTANTNVLTVQGIASGTTIPVTATCAGVGGTTDAKADVDGNGSTVAQLRRVTTDLAALSAKVTACDTGAVVGAVTCAGVGTATTAAVDGDANGSAVAHLRGINKKLAAGVAVTGAVTTSGTVTEASGAGTLTAVKNADPVEVGEAIVSVDATETGKTLATLLTASSGAPSLPAGTMKVFLQNIGGVEITRRFSASATAGTGLVIAVKGTVSIPTTKTLADAWKFVASDTCLMLVTWSTARA